MEKETILKVSFSYFLQTFAKTAPYFASFTVIFSEKTITPAYSAGRKNTSIFSDFSGITPPHLFFVWILPIFVIRMVKTWDSLFQSLAAGDKQAYEAIFREFYNPLVFYARKFVGDKDAAEDIVQGFFCHLWETRKRLTGIQSFKTYFYNAVRNRALNYLRDKHAVSLEGIDVQKEEDFLKEIMEEEIYRELYAAVRELPDKCRTIFMLKLAGKGNTEIASELDITEETVRSQLRRGRELLKKNIEGLLALSVLFCLSI